MNARTTGTEDEGWTEVAQLLERRATVQQWLQKLDAQRGTVSEKILARVREDYEKRLQDTLQELASHRDALDDELEQAAERLETAHDEHTRAEEALEEGRLRSSIGEIPEDAWESERVQLESSVTAATERAANARLEVERIREILEQFAGSEEEVATGSEPPLQAQPLPAVDPDATTELPPVETASFLDDIDRVISSVEEAPAVESADADELPSEETSPKPGLKCPECGYTNDLSAWFCGVCGADIG